MKAQPATRLQRIAEELEQLVHDETLTPELAELLRKNAESVLALAVDVAGSRNSPHHDILLVKKSGDLVRVPVNKTPGDPNEGRYVSVPEYPDPTDDGYRKVQADARIRDKGTKGTGPAFSTLPIRREAATSAWTCYLLNEQNLNYRNPWTISEWNDDPGDDPDDERPIAAHTGPLELLIAGYLGDVYYLRFTPDTDAARGGAPESAEKVLVDDKGVLLKRIALNHEAETWTSLRSGLVAGSVTYQGHDKTPKDLPLINLTSIDPNAPALGGSGGTSSTPALGGSGGTSSTPSRGGKGGTHA